jgi:Polyphosphate kinase 2 (PPK2)
MRLNSIIKEREYWNDYMAAFETMVRRTATKHAPWYVVPADNKWFTRAVVAAAIVDVLGSLDLPLSGDEPGAAHGGGPGPAGPPREGPAGVPYTPCPAPCLSRWLACSASMDSAERPKMSGTGHPSRPA